MDQATALPGLRGLQHVGVTVPDLDEAVGFFERVFAARALVRGGAVEAEDAWMQARLGASPDSRLVGLAILRVGHGTNVELLHYARADGLGAPPPSSSHSATHLAFEVDDIDAAIAHLRAHGVALLDGPGHVPDGDLGGLRWIYARAPWGLLIEILSTPDGLGYEARGPARLWDPKAPAA